jgi:hypothetical protein
MINNVLKGKKTLYVTSLITMKNDLKKHVGIKVYDYQEDHGIYNE